MALHFQKYVFSSVELVQEVILPLRAQGKKLVTTNGCFDLLHSGHIRYLADAAALGDILVVGINTDSVVRKLKGPDRPVQNENDRVFIVGSLKMVNYAFLFGDDDPRAFLQVLRPDIHVKGGDYPQAIIEKETVEKYDGTIKIVPYSKGYSTTSLIQKIQAQVS